MAKLKGIIFDMDGTLVNNLAYHFHAFEEFVRREGLTLLQPMSLKFNGMHSDDIFPLLLGEEQCSRFSLDYLNHGKEAVYRDMYHGHVEPVAGLLELLREAKACGIKCAIGSSGCRENVEFIISELGIEEYIGAAISGSDVTHGKPHPEIFSKAIEQLGLRAEECVVIEDGAIGIKAGIAAGCKCLGITTTSTAETLTECGATLCAPDFTTVTVKVLEALLND